MTHTTEAGKLWRLLRRQGFTVQRTKGGHVAITHVDMARPVFASSTPSDKRSLINAMAKVRRATGRTLT